MSERRISRVLGQHRSTQRKVPRGANDEQALTEHVIALAKQYGRYGYRRVTALLCHAGWTVNHKRVEWIWRREGLKVPQKQPTRGRLWSMVLDGPINGDWFEAYVGNVLVPDLRRADVVIMDSLSSHKRASVRALIEAAGARLMFRPPYSPDFNPIEKAFSRLKAMLRKAGERAVSGLWSLIGKLVNLFQPKECADYFSSCNYDPD